jgi:hypothetical protein
MPNGREMREDAKERMRVDKRIPPNAPHLAIISTVVLIVAGIVGATIVNDDRSFELLVGLIITTVPSLGAMAFAERASRDIRNGTVTEKARQGTRKALDETGVTQAVTEGQSTTPAALNALTALLERLNPEMLNDTKGGNDNDRGPTL